MFHNLPVLVQKLILTWCRCWLCSFNSLVGTNRLLTLILFVFVFILHDLRANLLQLIPFNRHRTLSLVPNRLLQHINLIEVIFQPAEILRIFVYDSCRALSQSRVVIVWKRFYFTHFFDLWKLADMTASLSACERLSIQKIRSLCSINGVLRNLRTVKLRSRVELIKYLLQVLVILPILLQRQVWIYVFRRMWMTWVALIFKETRMEVKGATRRTLAVNLRDIIAVLISLAVTSRLVRSKAGGQLVCGTQHFKCQIIRAFLLKLGLIIVSKDSLATLKTPAKYSSSAIWASFVSSMVRLDAYATASAFFIDWVIFLAANASWPEFGVKSITVRVCVVWEPVLLELISCLKISC